MIFSTFITYKPRAELETKWSIPVASQIWQNEASDLEGVHCLTIRTPKL